MKLATVAAAPGGASVQPVATWAVTTPVARGFQLVLYLRFDASGTSDALEIDASACQFDAVFQTIDYDALHSTPVAPLSVSKDSKAVIVKLDGPRRVLSVTLAEPPRNVELHRADGPVQADKAADAANFTDVNFAIQFPAPVAANQIKAVNVRGTPSNPRIGIAGVNGTSPFLFWPTPDQAGTLSVAAGPEFAGALQANLSGQWDEALKKSRQSPPVPLPQHVDVAVVIQSDAPCRIAISKFKAAYHRALTTFTPSNGPKEVLRFSGKRVERQSVAMLLPTSAIVVSAKVRVDESFRPGGGNAPAGGSEDLLGNHASPARRGIRLQAGDLRYAAQRAAASNETLSGIAIQVVSLSPGASLDVQLQPDYQGQPSGKKLGGASVSLPQAGNADWAIAGFEPPVLLSGDAFWILVSASKGSAIWLAEDGTSAPRLLQREEGTWSELSKMDGLEALWRPLPQSTPAEFPAGTGGTKKPARARVSVGGAVAAPSPDGSRTIDLTSAINTYLDTARSQALFPALTAVPLVFSASGGGLITVYPPHIVYDI